MANVIAGLLDTTGFPARWHCGIWSDALGWLHIGSDIAIFGAYTAIPLVLAYFVMRKRDVPFPKIFWLFVAFIFTCGFGHLLEAVIFWHPVYRLAGVVKFLTAVVSWGTVIALVGIVPYALQFPGLSKLNRELQHSNEGLRRAIDQVEERTLHLQGEVADRRRAEMRLEEHARQLEQFNTLAVDRELRMIELKKEVNSLASILGEGTRYDLDELDGDAGA